MTMRLLVLLCSVCKINVNEQNGTYEVKSDCETIISVGWPKQCVKMTYFEEICLHFVL